MRPTNLGAWFLVVCATASCGEWPPVVSTAGDASALRADQKSIRCIGCGDDALSVIGQRFEHLAYLFINDQARISDEGIRALSTLRRLRQLEVGNATLVTDAGIKAIKELRALEELSIENAPLISSGALKSLGEGLKLRRLFLINCANASAETILTLRHSLPDADVRGFE